MAMGHTMVDGCGGDRREFAAIRTWCVGGIIRTTERASCDDGSGEKFYVLRDGVGGTVSR